MTYAVLYGCFGAEFSHDDYYDRQNCKLLHLIPPMNRPQQTDAGNNLGHLFAFHAVRINYVRKDDLALQKNDTKNEIQNFVIDFFAGHDIAIVKFNGDMSGFKQNYFEKLLPIPRTGTSSPTLRFWPG